MNYEFSVKNKKIGVFGGKPLKFDPFFRKTGVLSRNPEVFHDKEIA